MAIKERKPNPADTVRQQLRRRLKTYQREHPTAQIEFYRQNSASIRIRIIDPAFAGISRADRHDLVWKDLEELGEDVLNQITVLLLLTPDETANSFANMEFEHPVPSRL